MPAVSKDGLSYTFKLRRGIKFHNGKEMTSDDVVASLTRWSKQSIYGKDLFAYVAELRAVDKYTVELKLKEKVAIVLINLAVANNFAAIYPKEIAEKFPPQEKATEFIGTGPYKLVEWKPDQHIRMVRFDDYKPRSEKRNGYGGAKIAYIDQIDWMPVPDVATRVAQMETGELQLADDLIADSFDRLKNSANARPIIAKMYYWLVAVLNKKEGLMTNQKLRQAWQAALDIEPIMKTVAAGRPEFYRMDYNLIHQELAAWHVKVQGLPWNENNKAKAKKLLQEAGYKGEPIRFMTTQEYKWMYDFALVSKQQLEDAGFIIDFQVVDWATLVKRRNNPKEYDAFTTGIGPAVRPDQLERAQLQLAGLDLRRADPEHQDRDDPRDRLQEAPRAVGADAQGLLREGPRHPVRRPLRPPGGLEEAPGTSTRRRSGCGSTTPGSTSNFRVIRGPAGAVAGRRPPPPSS